MTTTLAMPHRLDRSILINASRETVFGYFTDSTRWARWWGQGSTIDARAGGAVQIVHPGGVQVAGEILEIDPPTRLVFTYGYVSGTPMPVGASVVTIQLEDDQQGTRLDLSHVFADEKLRDEMVQGWRFQLSLFGNLVANDVHAGASTAVDGWFAAWSEPDTAKREALLDRLATEEVRVPRSFQPDRRLVRSASTPGGRAQVHARHAPRARGRHPPLPRHGAGRLGRARRSTAASAAAAPTSSRSATTAASKR